MKKAYPVPGNLTTLRTSAKVGYRGTSGHSTADAATASAEAGELGNAFVNMALGIK